MSTTRSLKAVEEACQRAGCWIIACDDDGAAFGVMFGEEPYYYQADDDQTMAMALREIARYEQECREAEQNVLEA